MRILLRLTRRCQMASLRTFARKVAADDETWRNNNQTWARANFSFFIYFLFQIKWHFEFFFTEKWGGGYPPYPPPLYPPLRFVFELEKEWGSMPPDKKRWRARSSWICITCTCSWYWIEHWFKLGCSKTTFMTFPFCHWTRKHIRTSSVVSIVLKRPCSIMFTQIMQVRRHSNLFKNKPFHCCSVTFF